jgi:outer membrane protein OmpA-like peptidoglycan-associated protein
MGSFADVIVFLSLVGFGQPGTSVMPVLTIDQGPRFAALGGAGIGAVDDASAIYSNPAGLGRVQAYRGAVSHHQWFAGIKDEVVHAALPSGQGAFGLGLVYSGEPGIEHWDTTNNMLPDSFFRTWNGVLSAGYGLAVAKDYCVGAAAKGFCQSLYTSGGYGGAVDVGLMCRPFPSTSLGAVARNVGFAKYDSTDSMGQHHLCSPRMPMELGLGGGLTVGPVNTVLDILLPLDGRPSLHFGAEYLPVPEFAVRLGYQTGPQDLGTLGILSGLSAGVGANVGPLSLDYAITPYGKLGTAHRIGLQAALLPKGLGSVRLRVVDGSNMLPLSANVTATGVSSYKGNTGTTGELRLTRLPAGDLVIYTSRPNYLPRVDSMYIVGDHEQSAVIALSPLTYGAVTGIVADAATRKPIGGSVVYQGTVQGSIQADSVLGSYVLRSLPAGQYSLAASGPTDEYVTQTCTLKVEPGRITNRDFYLVKCLQTIVLRGVNFETGKADLLPEFDSVLTRAGEILRANPGITVELAGHTDPREISTSQFPSNWELSQARAEAVRQYLITRWGIAPERLAAHGYADTQPIAPNNTAEGMAKNRRTEFRITGQQ